MGDVREKLEDSTKRVLDAFPGNAIVGRGLEKLLLDRTEFDTEAKTELSEFREKISSCSSTLLRGRGEVSLRGIEVGGGVCLEEYRKAVAQDFGISTTELGSQLYGDLPPFQQVLSFRKMSAEGLLHRYNCAQIQGLLLRCEAMTIRLPESGAAKLVDISAAGQVLAITHLPRIAGAADHHFRVEKVVEGGRTRTDVHLLQGQERVEELVRMVAGTSTTQAAATFARELLDWRTGESPP